MLSGDVGGCSSRPRLTGASSFPRPAPCPPTDIEAHRDCDANHALVTWQNHQPTGRYSATIEDQHGARLNCTSDTVNSCKIPAMPCGKRYGVTVTYHDGNCPSTSAAVSMDSGTLAMIPFRAEGSKLRPHADSSAPRAPAQVLDHGSHVDMDGDVKLL